MQLTTSQAGAAAEIRAIKRGAVVQVGRILLDVWPSIPSKGKKAFVEDCCGMRYDAAIRAIRTAEAFAELPVDQADITGRALYVLSASTVPVAARRAAVELGTNTPVGEKLARMIVEEYTETVPSPPTTLTHGSDFSNKNGQEKHDHDNEVVQSAIDSMIIDTEDAEDATGDSYEAVEVEVSYAEQFRRLWQRADDAGRLAIAITAAKLPEIQEQVQPAKPVAKKKSSSRFVKPTLDEVAAYCKERKNTVDPAAFVDHYTANGWKIGGRGAMKDWKAAVRQWERSRFKDHAAGVDRSQGMKFTG